MVKPYRNGWWLEIKYWQEGLTQEEMAEECDVSPRTIRKWMNQRGIETREIEGDNHPLQGQRRPREVRDKISATLDVREIDDRTRERMAEAHSGTELTADRKRKIAESLTGITRDEMTRQRMSESTSGKANPNWRGGYSRRYGSGWSLAREAVRERDEVCQHCGHKGSERRLEVHHIEPVRHYRKDPDRRLEDAHDLDNLVLLCRSCHVQADHGQISLDRFD